MFQKPVHRHMSLVQCPLCHDTFMEEGDECCRNCLDRLDPGATPEEFLANRERLHDAVKTLHDARLQAEADSGALGSLVGMGFAPSWIEPTSPHPSPTEPGRSLPVHAPTYAADTGWRGPSESQPSEPVGEPAFRAIHTPHVGHLLLGAAGSAVVLTMVVFAIAALLAGLALGAAVYLLWRLLMAPRR